ncbi:fumarate hydratase [Mucilaginibacter endophyticus]|uniref:fumarate hydratase n=1 Tax=Mucilaginibacter endophyticus TaxID=2675003 RepID=UPI001379E547|nr:fumarate hydratase [Mucilaginibacter endophyticus]
MQKRYSFLFFSFSFRLFALSLPLSAFSSKKAFRLLPFAFCLIVASCSRNPDMQEPGDSKLQGEWRQDSVPAQKSLVTYSLYDIKFSCDSFLLKISTVSKVNYGADTCMSKGHWAEYVRGTYSQRQDTLHIKGQFCNADGSYKNEQGCFRFGDYEEYFKVHLTGDSLIRFVSTSNVIPINAHLIKRTSCIPKPL